MGLFGACLVLLYVVSLVALQHFAAIERDEMVEDVVQAQSLLQSEISQLVTTAGDYAAWDDTYRFVQDRNKDYIVHGLGETFFSKLRLNLYCVVTVKGELAYSRFDAPDSHKHAQLPAAISQYLGAEGLLASNALKLKETGGIIALPDGLMLIAASPILTTESHGPVRGTLVIGRVLTVAEIQRIAGIANFNMNLLPLKNTATAAPIGLGLLLHDTRAVTIKKIDKDTLQGQVPLTDITKHQVGLLTLDKPRHAYREARNVIFLLDILVSFAFIFVAVTLLRISKKLAVVSLNEHLLDVQLRVFIEMAVDAIYRLDKQRVILSANQKAAEITGWRVTDLIGRSFDTLFDQAELQKRPFNEELLSSGGTDMLRLTLNGQNNARIPVLVRLKHLPNGICQCVMQDLTEQTQWENTLHRHEELLNGIVNGTNDIVYAKDLDGRYLLINAAGVAFTEKALEAILGRHDQDIFSRDIALVLMEADQKAMSSAEIMTSEDTLRKSDGTEAIFLSTRGRLTDKDGNVIGLFAILHDITVRTMLEKELLEQHNKLGQMSVKISLAEEHERVRIAEELHDQVGPTLLLGKMKLEMLQARLSDQALVESSEEIGALIAQSVKDIRSLTLQLRPPILANAGLEAAVKWLAEEFQHKYHLVVTLYDDRQPKPLLYEKRTILFQAIRELLLNVVKHAQSESVAITLNRDGVFLQVLIEDTGVGFQAVKPDTGHSASNGFGLFNITQKLKHIHGSLTVNSTPGFGTKVMVLVPLDLEQ